jgi:hypothetical protein
LKIFENRAIMIFDLERAGVTGVGDLRIKERYNLYLSSNVVRVMKQGERNGRSM